MLFLLFGRTWFGDLSNPLWFALMLAWLFGAISISAFAVVRHAEGLAERVGEPLGTLVLTLSMSGMEMMMIAAVMYFGAGGAALGRDTMLAILMVVLNGLVGASLLVLHNLVLRLRNVWDARAAALISCPASLRHCDRYIINIPDPAMVALATLALWLLVKALQGGRPIIISAAAGAGIFSDFMLPALAVMPRQPFTSCGPCQAI